MNKDLSIRYLIHQLLLEHDFIIVPGFGAFMTHPRPAYFDQNLNEFIKPSKSVQFNPRIQQNDGILAHAFSKEFNISLDQAYAQIQLEINTFQSSKSPIDFYNLGFLQVQLDGSFDFTPHLSSDLDDSVFGLDNILVKPVQIHQPLVLNLSSPTSNKSRNLRYFSYAAASLFLVFISLLSLKMDLWENSSEALMGWSYSGTPTYKSYSMEIGSDSYSDEFDLLPGKKISFYYLNSVTDETEGVFLETPVENSISTQAPSSGIGKFTIIIAAFSNPELAEKYCKSQQSLGKDAHLIPSSSSMLLVGLGQYESKSDAQNKLTEIQSTFPLAWIK
ncbi:MAG: SPOR domain-containing protein [Bacteroidia bacterium]|nr:SPOR domain-containing protein [Bacteroidia bacterium]